MLIINEVWHIVKFSILFKFEFSDISSFKISLFDTLDIFINFILFKFENIWLIFSESTLLKSKKDISKYSKESQPLSIFFVFFIKDESKWEKSI